MTTINKISKRSAAGIKIALALVAVCVSANSFARDVAPVEAPTLVKPKPTTVSPRPRSPGSAVACTPAPFGTTGYSTVFKGCDPLATFNALYYDKTECVRDNATGKMWQGQTPAGTGLRANDQLKTHFDDITKPQKGYHSNHVTPTQAEVDALNNSIGFKTAVNATNLCGFNDWRLPTSAELQAIRLPLDPNAPASTVNINLQWFPNTPIRQYWSSTPSTVDHRGTGVGYNLFAFSDNFRSTGDHLVRLVRP